MRPVFLHLTAIIETGWLILALVPCALLIFAAVLVSYPAPYTSSGLLLFYLFGIAIVVIYFAIFQYLAMQYRLQMTKQNATLLEFQMNRLKDRLSADALAAEKSRIDRHDTRHMLCTTVSRESGHGIGTRSIFAFCKKYHALYNFSVSDGQFVLRLML